MSNNDVGGRLFEMGEMEFMVRGLGYIQSVEDLKKVSIGVSPVTGTPVYLEDVADVIIGPELRRGLADWNGEGEVAGGIVLLRYGENALTTINAVKERLAELKKSLPQDVEIEIAYDRTGLIERASAHLKEKNMRWR